jgi:biotin operon repressor
MTQNSFITLDDLSVNLKISRVAVKKHIAKLKSLGLLERIGGTRSYWKIINTTHNARNQQYKQ